LRFSLESPSALSKNGNRATPEGRARAYLVVIERIPEAVIAALKVEKADKIGHTGDRDKITDK
jgi:hypothetical protein